MLAILLISAVGCGDDATSALVEADQELASTSAALITPCTPDSDFTSCTEIDLSQTETWQDTLPNPDWRDVQPSSEPNIDYEIVIDVRELNDGVIPTALGQGEYTDDQDYLDTYSQLLGVNISKYTYSLTVIGTTVKQATDGGPVAKSTGVFVYDALTDEDRRLVIDNVDVTDDILQFERVHDFQQEIYQDGSTTPLSYTFNDGPSPINMMSQWYPPTELEDQALLSSGEWRADLKMFNRPLSLAGVSDVIWLGVAITEISGVRAQRHGLTYSCIYRWIPGSNGNFLTGTMERHCNNAKQLITQLELIYPYYQLSPQGFTFSETAISTAITWGHNDHFDEFGDACGEGEVLFNSSGPYFDKENVYTLNTNPNDCIIIGN